MYGELINMYTTETEQIKINKYRYFLFLYFRSKTKHVTVKVSYKSKSNIVLKMNVMDLYVIMMPHVDNVYLQRCHVKAQAVITAMNR